MGFEDLCIPPPLKLGSTRQSIWTVTLTFGGILTPVSLLNQENGRKKGALSHSLRPLATIFDHARSGSDDVAPQEGRVAVLKVLVADGGRTGERLRYR